MARILLVRTDGIGDVLLSLPVAAAIKEERPGDEVWLLTRSYTRELGENNPHISGVLTLDVDGKELSFGAMLLVLKAKSFDAAVLIYPRFTLALLVRAAGIPVRIGTGYRWYSFLFNRKVYEHRKNITKHELEYNLSLLEALGIHRDEGKLVFHIPPEARQKIDALLADMHTGAGGPVIVVHPGSGGSALDWPFEKYCSLVRSLYGKYKTKILITAGPNEKKLLTRFKENCEEEVLPVYGDLSLSELGALLERASLVITNSTGPLHLAVAVGTEVIGLYPPIRLCSPLRWGPYGRSDSVLQPACGEFETRKEALKKMPDCMDMISVESVLELAVKKLNIG